MLVLSVQTFRIFLSKVYIILTPLITVVLNLLVMTTYSCVDSEYYIY